MQGSTRIDELRQKFHENPRRYFAPLANEYRKAGDPEQAIAICRAHLAQQPGHMSGHVVYGQALYDARRTEEARGVFEKALALDPDNAIVLRHLGDIAREKGEDTEARHWYTRALEADPGDKEIAAYIAELTEPLTETGPTPVEPPVEPTVAAQSAEMVVEEIRPDEPQELEIAMPEPAREPEIAAHPHFAPVPEEEPPAPVEEDVTWRKTPPHEDSPFVTRTMAELYAKQGYREAALDVYRQLALHHPDDKEIFDRIEALEKDTQAASADTPPAEKQDEHEAPGQLPDHRRPTPTTFAFEPLISDLPSEPEPEAPDMSETSPFAPAAEDLNLDTISGKGRTPHFTELELGGGDTWDTDAWGAGFSAEDESVVEISSSDVHSESVSAGTPPDVAEPERQPETEPAPEPEPEPADKAEIPVAVVEPAPEVAPEPEAEPEPAEIAAAEPEAPSVEEAEPVVASAAEPEVIEPEVIEPEVIEPEVIEPEREPEPQFVAYSPQPPADEDLPHFAPPGPTVREFFASLGAYRPPSRDGRAITAHAAASELAAPDDYPLAKDAFASLFADSPVSEEDSRAAFALSGALSAPAPPAPVPAAPPAPAAEPSPSSTQESEEDIRRFREWLDGLAES